MPSKQENNEIQLQERDLSARPALPDDYMQERERIREQAKAGFFKFQEGDTAVIQLVKRDLIPTENGDSPVWTGLYTKGNIHGTGGGAPADTDQGMRFWEVTVLASQFKELEVRPGDTVFIDCLGEKKGKHQTYMNFACEIVSRGTTSDDGTEWIDPATHQGDEQRLIQESD